MPAATSSHLVLNSLYSKLLCFNFAARATRCHCGPRSRELPSQIGMNEDAGIDDAKWALQRLLASVLATNSGPLWSAVKRRK